MSEPTDNKPVADGDIEDEVFDAYLDRKSEVSERYRALGADEVPAALDRSVLAQARAAVADKVALPGKRPAWTRWITPLALAASTVLVVSIVMRSGTQHQVSMRDTDATEYERAEAPVSSGASVAEDAERDAAAEAAGESLQVPVAPPPAAQAMDLAAASPGNEKSRERRAPKRQEDPSIAAVAGDVLGVTPEPAVQPPVEVASPSPVAPTSEIHAANGAVASNRSAAPTDKQASADASDLSEIVVTGQLRTRRPDAGVGPRGSIPPPVAASEPEAEEANASKLEKQRRESNPGDWLEHIRKLRQERKAREADREWRRFLDTYPQYPVDAKDAARPGP